MSKTNTIQSNRNAAKPDNLRSKGTKPTSGKNGDGVAAFKPLTKKARLIAMLEVRGGATIGEISEELGWLQHTTRAALTGLRKAGFDILVTKPDGGGAGRHSVSKVSGKGAVS